MYLGYPLHPFHTTTDSHTTETRVLLDTRNKAVEKVYTHKGGEITCTIFLIFNTDHQLLLPFLIGSFFDRAPA